MADKASPSMPILIRLRAIHQRLNSYLTETLLQCCARALLFNRSGPERGRKNQTLLAVAILEVGKLSQQFHLIIEHGIEHLFRYLVVRIHFEFFEPLLNGLVNDL